jgi:Amidohydrolase family
MREQFSVSPQKELPPQAHARIARWQREILDSYSQQAADALIQKFAEKSVWQTPTLILLKNNAFPTLENSGPLEADPRLKYIPHATLDLWKRGHAEKMHFVSQPESDLRKRLFTRSLGLVSRMQKADVHILAGTDSPAPYVFPGFSLHDELQLLVQAGLTPMEALQTATRNPAAFLGTAKDSGTTAAGKYADLVLLDANPLDDIRNTQKIRGVILRGKLLDRAALDQLLETARAFPATH